MSHSWHDCLEVETPKGFCYLLPSCFLKRVWQSILWAFPGGSVVKNPPANTGNMGLIPGLWRSPGEGNGSFPGESHGQRSLAGYSPWCCRRVGYNLATKNDNNTPKGWLIGKDPDAGRDRGQEEKGTAEDEMAGWHHRLDGRESQWTPGVGDGQGGLACCDSWGRKESDTSERLIWSEATGYLATSLPEVPGPDWVSSLFF